ncbi:MAG: hypothetical protein OEV66_03045 [Spirochaetia bacterium]|nr:hypothetical protein [Spirochaetia bacterium]
MIESFFRAFQHSREHWVFGPFMILIVQIVLYNFLFSKNGYLSYLEKTKEKISIKIQIEELNAKKTQLSKKLDHMKNENQVIKDFIRKLYFYDDKYSIVKFIDEQKNPAKLLEKKLDLPYIQRSYTLISTVLLLLLTVFFWKKNQTSQTNEA